METLVAQIASIRTGNRQVMLVSSGAVGLGMRTLGLQRRPKQLSMIQALAATGQSKLMAEYEKASAVHGFHVAQLLLTAEDLRDRSHHLNIVNCIGELWNSGILPIINENDSVSVAELKFGDNDMLAALLASMTRADLTILLTTVDGLHTTSGGKLDKRISVVQKIESGMMQMAAGTDDSSLSTGGMASKLKAAQVVTAAGGHIWIADGRDPRVLERIFNAEDVGTLFLPQARQLESRKRWIGFFSKPKGSIYVDKGAAAAILERGKSLLPSGITRVKGEFGRGDTIEICNNESAPFARGLANYGSAEIKVIAGKKTSDMQHFLESPVTDDEVVHRNNMVILENK